MTRATSKTPVARRGRWLVAAAIATGALGAITGPAFAAAPQWHITMTHHNPYGAQGSFDPFTEKEGDKGETFARESGDNAYTIDVENMGVGTSAGRVTVTDHLPEGIMLGGESKEEASGEGWVCKVVERGEEAICFTEKALEPNKSFAPVTLHVHVKPDAANPSTNVATVTGGGTPPPTASTIRREGETTITEAVPFGLNTFTTALSPNPLTEPLSEHFSQAGGHPFAVSTEVVVNYTTNDNEAGLGPAGGPVKEIQAEVPPGFTGNPQNTPRCPFALLKPSVAALLEQRESSCPLLSAVGYTEVSLAGGRPGSQIIGGKAEIFPPTRKETSSLVYSLEPAPGSPADFGFGVFGGLPFVLDAKVRSGRDYGVTVGDSAIGEKVVGARLTLCENGARREIPPGGEVPRYSCNPAPPSAKPLLTNVTQCASSPPVTTLSANPWDEQANYKAKTVYTGTSPEVLAGKPSPTESFATGCNLLQFRPEIEFKPSSTSANPASEDGGTTQADSPTGMTFVLKIPQSNKAETPATPELKNLEMTLPAGMTVSPSAADGLQACSNEQFWPSARAEREIAEGRVPQREDAQEQEAARHREPAVPAQCPQASQIATVEIFTPLLSGAPTIEGVPGKYESLGRTIQGFLKCLPGMWANSPETTSYAYQWLRSGKEIPGATGPEYTPVETEDNGKALQCQVTATNAGASSVAVSRDVVGLPEPIGASQQPPLPPPSIAAPSSRASVGSTLACAGEAWTGENVTLSYAWLHGGEPIGGANEQHYIVAPGDAGKSIQCQITGTNAAGSAIADSAAVVAEPVPTPAPPVPGGALQGHLFVGEPECSPCTVEDEQAGKLLRLFLQVENPLHAPNAREGLIVKLRGTTYADPATGQLTTKFLEQPQQPFELAQVKIKGGARAPLASPQTCGPVETVAGLTPWSAPGLGGPTGTEEIPGTRSPASARSTFEVTGCPPTAPFNPSFNAGTAGPAATTAGAFTQFALTFAREDREQDLSGLEVHLPLGLVGKIAAIKQCGEAEIQAAEADQGECPAESQIGTATAGAGPGPHPFFQKGKVYLTGPYKGGPFGLAVVTPAVAGPFNLGNIVVRAAIMVDPNTAAVTTISDPLPQFRDGVQLRLRKVYVEVNNRNFMINPTNCNAQQVSATLTSARGASAQVSSPFRIGGCANLPFHPEFTAEAGGHGSKPNGTSFIVKVKATPGEANIRKTFLQLPIALPSRLTTIQKACLAATFEANPAICGEGSNIGFAVAHTPLLKNPLVGPAYLVSHGGAAFPDVEFVLQGEGITLILDGKTDIKSAKGTPCGGPIPCITYSRFETVPDAPVESFETVLPAGPHSALTTNVPESENFSLCKQPPLLMPTEITGQNGAVIRQTTHITLLGCAPTVKIAKVKVSGNAVVVTVTTSATGTVRISGSGLKTTSKALAAGTHQLRVPLTKNGRTMRRHHKKTTVHVSLTVGKQVAAKTAAVRL